MSTIKSAFFTPPPQVSRSSAPSAASAPPASPPNAAPPPARSTSGFEPARRQGPVALSVPPPPPQASTTLRDEVLGDGRSLCLEDAYRMARPGEQVVLLADRDDPVGHAVVRHADGSVTDPAHPRVRYPDLGSYLAQHRDLGSPVAISRDVLGQVLKQPPGPARDAALRTFGLEGVANRQVAGEDRFTSPLDPTSSVNCRSATSTGTDNVQGRFAGGTQLTVLEEKQGDDGYTWYRVSGQGLTVEGQPMSEPLEGWVRADVVTPPATEEQWAAMNAPPPDAGAYNIDMGLLSRSRASNPVPGASLAERIPHYSQGDGLWDQFLLRQADNGNTEVTQEELRAGLPESATPGEVLQKENEVLNSRLTVQSVGCAVTSTAMAISAMRAQEGLGPIHPGHVLNGGNVMNLAGDVTIGDHVYHRAKHTPLDIETIRAELAAGRPVMLQVTPTDTNIPNHYIVITGIDEQGNLTALDPGYRADSSHPRDAPCQEITLPYNGENSWASDRYNVPSDRAMYTFSQTP